MKEFKLTLTVNETNLILKALSELPYKQVSDLVTKIHTQAQQQLMGTDEPVTETAMKKNGNH